MAIKPKSYVKNLMKSFGMAGSDVIKDKATNIVNMSSTVQLTTGDAMRFFREQRTNLKRTANSFSRDLGLNEGKGILKDIKTDLLTGRFYDSLRMDDFEGDLDFDSLDDLFDDIEDPDEKKSKIDNVRSKIISHENRQNSEMISRTLIGTTNAMMSQSRAMNTIFYNQTLQSFSTLNSNLKSINDNAVKSLAEIQVAQKANLDNASKFYAESLDLQKKMVKLLEKMQPLEAEKKYSVTGVDKVLSFGSSLDMDKYMKQVRSNFSNTFFDPGMVSAPLQMLQQIREGTEGGRLIDNPLGMIPKYIMGSLIPKTFEKNLKIIDEMFSDLPRVLFRRLEGLKRNSYGGIMELVGDIFGVSNKLQENKDQYRKYEKGRVAWDGKSKKALEEVIPGYLSEIASALTGKDAKVYDYETATYKTLKQIKADQKSQFDVYAKSAYEDIARGVDSILNRMNIDNETRRTQDRELNKVYSYLFKNDRSIDKNSINELKEDNIGNELIYKMFQQVLNTREGVSGNAARVRDISTLEKAKSNYNEVITNTYNSANNWLYNGLHAKQGDIKSSPVGMALTEVKDKYQNSMFDYVRQIAENTSGYSREDRRGYSTTNTRNYGRNSRSPRVAQTTSSNRQTNTTTASGEEAALSGTDDDLINQLGKINVKDLLEDPTFKSKSWVDTINVGKKVSEKMDKTPFGKVVTNASVVVSSMLEKILVGSDGHGEKMGIVDTLRDIFDNPDSRMGKFLDSVEKAENGESEIKNVFNKLVENIKGSISANPTIQTVKEFGGDVKDAMLDSLIGAKDTVVNSFVGVKDDVASRLKDENSFLNAIKRGIFNDDIQHYAAGGTVPDDGKSRKLKKRHRLPSTEITRPTLAVVSPNEVILTGEEAKKYKKLKRKARVLGESTISDEDRDLYKRGNFSDKYKSFLGYTKDNSFEKLLKSYNVGQVYSDVMNSLFGITEEQRQAKGEDKKGDSSFFKVRKEIFDTFKRNTAKMASSGLLGAIGATALGVIGGPLTGAAAGITMSLIKNSDSLKQMLFGDLEKNKEGLVPRNIINTFNKYFPDIKKYGITSAVLGALPITPFGPIGGLMLGSAVSFVKNNQGLQNELFGAEGLFGPKAKEMIEKHSKKILAGAAIGALTGPFGLVGNVILGSTISMATTTDKFKIALFGEKDAHGKYQHGVLPSIRDKVVVPLKNFATDIPNRAKEFLKNEVANPIKEAMKPLLAGVSDIAKSIKRGAVKLITLLFRKFVATPVYGYLEKWILDPAKKAVKSVYGAVTGLAKGIILAPVKGISALGRMAKDKQIVKGKSASYMTAGERLNYASMRGLKVDDEITSLDQTLQGADLSQLEEISEQLKLIDAIRGERSSAKFSTFRDNSRRIFNSSDKLKPGDMRYLNKAFKKNYTGDDLDKVISDIGVRRKMDADEYKRFREAVLSHRQDVSNVLSGDKKFNEEQTKTLNELLGTSNIEDKMNILDILARSEAEIKNRKALSVVDPETKEVIEPSADIVAKHDLDKVLKDLPEYHSGVLGKLQELVNILTEKTVGVQAFDTAKKNKRLREEAISRGLSEEYLNSMENPDEIRSLYQHIADESYNAETKKHESRKNKSIARGLYRAGVNTVSNAAMSIDTFNYLYGNKRYGDGLNKVNETLLDYNNFLKFEKSSEKDARYEETPFGKLRYIYDPVSKEYILDESNANNKKIKNLMELDKKGEVKAGFKDKLVDLFVGKKTGFGHDDKDIPSASKQFSNAEKVNPDVGEMYGPRKPTKIDKTMDALSNLKSSLIDQAKSKKNSAKVHYEYTKYGVLKFITNDRGKPELDNSDVETRQTLAKQQEAEGVKVTDEKTEKDYKKTDSKEEKEGKGKKKGILGKILGLAGIVGGAAKGILGKLSAFTGIGKAATAMSGGGGGGLLFGGARFLMSPLGILSLVFMAPFIKDHILPVVEKNFNTKIMPFVKDKAIPATVEVITKMTPYIAKLVVEGVKTAVPLVLKTMPGLIKDLVTGNTARGLVDTAVGVEPDVAYTKDEEGNTIVDPDAPLSDDRYYNHSKDHMGARFATKMIVDNKGAVTSLRPSKASVLAKTTKRYVKGKVGRALAPIAESKVGSKVIGGMSKAGTRFGEKMARDHKITYYGAKGIKTAFTAPQKILGLPATVLQAGKGHRKEAIAEALSGDMLRAAENSAKGKSLRGFKEIMEHQTRAAESIGKHMRSGGGSISSKIISKLSSILLKLVHAPFIRSVVPAHIVEKLAGGGIQEIAKHLGEIISKKVAKEAGEGALKAGVKAGARVGLRGLSGLLTAGVAQVAFAIWDAYDGWHNAGKYLGIGKDLDDQISPGMRFTSALFKVLSGLFVVTSFIPPEAYLKLYMSIISKIFGEDKFYKTKKLQQETKDRLAEYNKAHPKEKLNQKQYDDKVKSGEIDKNGKATGKKGGGPTGFSGLIKKFTTGVTSVFNAIFGGNGKKDPLNKIAMAGRGPDILFKNAGGYAKDIDDSISTMDKSIRRTIAYNNAGGYANDKASGSYYSQNDSRWGNNKLGNTNMKDAGCGPTSLAMALSDTTGKKYTPDKIAKDNQENLPGYSTWGLFPSVARKYNLGYNRVAPNAKELTDNLRRGEVVISGMRSDSTDPSKSPFTNAGHIVVAKGLKNGKVQIADPRGKSYNRSYDINNVLNDMTLGFRYSKDSAGTGSDTIPYSGHAGTGVGEHIDNIINNTSRQILKPTKEEKKRQEKSKKDAEKNAEAESQKSTPGTKLGDKVVAFAREMKPYVKYSYGSDSFKVKGPSTGDCSSFTKFIFKEAAGVQLPRSSSDQRNAGKEIKIGEVGAGDLAVYSGHVGIFTDNKGNVIHNSMPGVNVIEGNYKQAGNGKQVFPRRVLPDDQIGAGGLASSGVNGSSGDGSSGGTVSGGGGDPFSSFFGKIGGAFTKGLADLFGLKTEEPSSSGGLSPDSSSNTDTNADNSTQDPGSPGEHMKLNRPDNTSAAQIDAYLKKMNATSDWNGAMFKKAQAATGISPVDILVWAALESAWGKSRIARTKHNYFGIGAIDTNPMGGAYTFSPTDGIVEGAKWINKHYVRGKYKQDNWYDCFKGPTHRYSTTPSESNNLTAMREKFYAWAKSAGKGPDAKTAKYFNDMFKVTPGDEKEFEEAFYAGGADDKKDKKSDDKYPDNLNGFPYYSQCDPRWNKNGMNMTWTGCGPTSTAIVATAATGKRITPLETGKAAIKHGLWNGNNASSHSIFPVLGKEFGFEAVPNKGNKEFFNNASKKIVQFAVGTGASPFTSGGHYVVALGEDSNGKIVTNNPISKATSQAFDKSRYNVTRVSWHVNKDGKPLTWDGHSEVSGGNSGGTDMGMTKDENNKMAGADLNPIDSFFGKIGGAFTKGLADLFGLKTEEPAQSGDGSSGDSGDGASINSFKDAVVSTFQDSTVSWGRGRVGDNVVAAHNMTFGTKVSIPRFKGKAGGGKFNAADGKTYDLGPDKNGVFMVADNGGPFFDFDVHSSEDWKGNTDVNVLEWGSGPKTWTLTEAIKHAKGSEYGGNFYTHSNAFKQVFTKYGGFKTSELTKFGTEDKNNPELHPNAGKGDDIGDAVTKYTIKYTKKGMTDPNKFPLTDNQLGSPTSPPSVLDRFFNSTLKAKKSSNFGERNVAGFGDFHSGVDYDTFGKSRPILSPVEGKVVRTFYSKDNGKSVVIKDWFGNTHHFDHLASKDVSPGQIIQAYDPIGKVGETGAAVGKHLHYEIMDKKSQSMDPDEYLKMYGAFGGKQNIKINNNIDKDVFKDINQDIVQATRTSSMSNDMYKVFEILLKAILKVLGSINIHTESTANTVSAIVNILNKYSDKLPPEARQDIDKLTAMNKSLAALSTGPEMSAVNAKRKDSHLINTDVREVMSLMNHLGTE